MTDTKEDYKHLRSIADDPPCGQINVLLGRRTPQASSSSSKNRSSVLIIVSTCASLLLFLVSWWTAPANPINASTMVATPDAALISGIEHLLFQVRVMRATTLCALLTAILSQVYVMRLGGGKDD